jgi:hypothetical protein
LIEVEVQNETHQTQERIRFAAVPRIGEGIRLREPDGCWASYDILDLWYQKADYGDVWVPYLHVCMTPSEQGQPQTPKPAYGAPLPEPAEPQWTPRETRTAERAGYAPAPPASVYEDDPAYGDEPPVYGEEEFEPFTG